MDIAAMSQKLAGYLRTQLVLTDNDEAVLAFSIHSLVTGTTSTIAIIIVSWFLGVLKLALIATFTAGCLRMASGGAHSARALNCTILGMVISPGIALLAKHQLADLPGPGLIYLCVFTALVALTATHNYAPADTPNKPITNPVQRRQLRRISAGLVMLWLAVALFIIIRDKADLQLYVTVSALSIIWQSFSITPIGYRAIAGFDRLMPKAKHNSVSLI